MHMQQAFRDAAQQMAVEDLVELRSRLQVMGLDTAQQHAPDVGPDPATSPGGGRGTQPTPTTPGVFPVPVPKSP